MNGLTLGLEESPQNIKCPSRHKTSTLGYRKNEGIAIDEENIEKSQKNNLLI